MQENNGTKPYLLITTSVMIVVMLGWFIASYNSLVSKEEHVKTAWSQVESNLQRKVDLLPNLVKVVKHYATHEKEVFEKITSLRADVMETMKQSEGKVDAKSIESLAKIQSQLNGSVLKLFAVAENYPELRSSEQFLQLQSQIEGAENRINITRMQFNESVGVFNHYMRTIPANMVAGVAGFQRKAYFKAEKEAHKKYKVEI